jgi:protein-tyrosine phosphatase
VRAVTHRPRVPRILFLCSGNYYRSRYAEIVFNSLARAAGIEWTATSAGLRPENFSVNPGPISRNVLAAARDRGYAVPDPARAPRGVTEHDLEAASLVIAMKESEHRPILEARFAGFAQQVTYWSIHDVDVAPPHEVLPIIEKAMFDLVAELKTRSPFVPPRDR